MSSTNIPSPPPWDPSSVAERNQRLHEGFKRESAAILARHAAQTVAEAEALRKK